MSKASKKSPTKSEEGTPTIRTEDITSKSNANPTSADASSRKERTSLTQDLSGSMLAKTAPSEGIEKDVSKISAESKKEQSGISGDRTPSAETVQTEQTLRKASKAALPEDITGTTAAPKSAEVLPTEAASASATEMPKTPDEDRKSDATPAKAETSKSKAGTPEASTVEAAKEDKSEEKTIKSREASKISAAPTEGIKTPNESVGSEEEDMRGSVSSHMLKTPQSPRSPQTPQTPDYQRPSPGTRSPATQKLEMEEKEQEATPPGWTSPVSQTFPSMSEREFLSRLGVRAPKPHEPFTLKDPIRVLVTAATTETSYLMLVPLARGDVFGLNQPIFLHLYDQSENITELQGVGMEIEDCSFPLLKQVVTTSEDEVAFLDIDVAFLNDSAHVEERSAFVKCVETYVGHGRAIASHAKKTVKVVVSGTPGETNTFICARNAQGIPSENFSALARLNHNRAVTLLSQALGVVPNKIVNMIVWGHKGPTLYPDYSKTVVIKKTRRYRITDLVSHDYLQSGLPRDVQMREELVEKLTKHQAVLSRVKAACDQMRDWWIGLPAGQYVSMGVMSDGAYGVATDIVFSYPVTIDNNKRWRIVQGLPIDEHVRECISDASKELEHERDEAMETCDELGL